MKLKSLISALDNYRLLHEGGDFEVRGISNNSRDVKDGFLFVAIRGNRDDGNKFIAQAVKKGAQAIIKEGPGGDNFEFSGVSLICVDDARKALAKLSAEFYGHPAKKLKISGVTGTNGKTTITYLMEALLKQSGFHPAVVGTINYRFGDQVFAAKNTTPGPLELQSLFARMLESGVDHVVMEVSSHALSQQRTAEINFSSAIFTNLTQDHLDYHIDLEDYFQAKMKLFSYLSPQASVIVNNDDAYGRRIIKETPAKVITYGIENKSDFSAEDIVLDILGSQFKIVNDGKEASIRTRLIGKHNIYNILAACAWARAIGILPDKISRAMAEFGCVPGRLERIDLDEEFRVFVDYAHTDDALKNVISSLREVTRGRIIVVFGCGGDRDKFKRPKMGKVATELADYCVITSDNPRSEDPREIINDILKGITKTNYCVIVDRAEAIKKSLSLANAADIVLIAGKGHEHYQIFKDRTLHFDDKEVVKKCLSRHLV